MKTNSLKLYEVTLEILDRGPIRTVVLQVPADNLVEALSHAYEQVLMFSHSFRVLSFGFAQERKAA